MALLEQTEEDITSTKILHQLSQTQYTCSSLSQLSSRPTNFVYRGVLAQPFPTQDGTIARSIIIKHCTEAVAGNFLNDMTPCVFDESLLKSIAESSTLSTTSTIIKAPRLFLFNRETNTQILEDFHDTDGFKSMLLSKNVENLLPNPSPVIIGRHLGSWLRSFHTWALAPEQAALQAQVWQNDRMRKIKYVFTYDSFLKVLENYPELLKGHEKTLKTVQDVMAKEFEKPSTEEDEGWGLIHGDFWSGNILLPNTTWQEPPLRDGANKIFIIDWEFAQFGHRSYDLGQIVGDLYERKMVSNIDTAISCMQGVINGYGEVSDEMAFRTAIYVGVHLISWYNRRPRKGPKVAPPEVIVASLTVGRDFIVKGWEKDRKFFEGSALASLFASK